MRKILNISLSVVFICVIFGFSAAFIISPDREFSQQENRTLAQLPKVSIEKIADGTFSAEINNYFADQFFARDSLVGIKGVVELSLGKGENNGVLIGKNNQLASRLFTMYKSRLEQTPDTDFFYADNLKLSINNLNKYAENETRPLITLLPPRTVDVASSAFMYPDSQGKALNELIKANISEKCGYIDLFSTFREKYNAGEYVYYKTDHHWTAEGAYIAYCEIMKKWGLEKSIIPKESFKFEKIKGFYGTTWSKAGMKFVPPDTMEIWSLGNDDDFVTDCISEQVKKSKDNKRVTVKQKYKSFSGWLNRDYLEKKNKYAAFLDGTHNEQTVFLKSGEKRERLLIVKDSFANTLVPFLAQHFDLVIINLSNNISNATKYANEYECNRVLIVYNFENLTGSNSLAGIK